MIEPKTSSPFRVIVVGAGVSGLAASHAFQKAGIDHVVLERRSTVAPAEGASIAMYPHGSRILHQFGALEAIRQHCNPPGRWVARMPSGKAIANNGVFRILEQNHGSGLLLIERRQFLQEMYDTLPDKTHVRTGCSVRDVIQNDSGIEVVLSNGEVEKGDLVLGCDGVYSSVRTLMWDHANKITPNLITAQEKRAIRADWKCLVLMTPSIPELGYRDLTVVHNKDYSHMFTMTQHKAYFFVFFKLDKPCIWPNRPRYTDQDAQELAQSIADHPISESMVFGEIWKRRTRAVVVNLEEGVLDHWFSGRITLAGDAVHKVTPNMAFGGNSGIESVAVLTNHLRRMLVSNQWSKPSMTQLQSALQGYQEERVTRMKKIMTFSGEVTRVQAWSSLWNRFLATMLIPLLPDRIFGDQLGEMIAGGAKLDFVDVGKFPSGRMSWADQGSEANKRELAAITQGALMSRARFNWLSALATFFLVFFTARMLPLTQAATQEEQ